jgi:hypothetical protein
MPLCLHQYQCPRTGNYTLYQVLYYTATEVPYISIISVTGTGIGYWLLVLGILASYWYYSRSLVISSSRRYVTHISLEVQWYRTRFCFIKSLS